MSWIVEFIIIFFLFFVVIVPACCFWGIIIYFIFSKQTDRTETDVIAAREGVYDRIGN